jgi:hypothetical protein
MAKSANQGAESQQKVTPPVGVTSPVGSPPEGAHAPPSCSEGVATSFRGWVVDSAWQAFGTPKGTAGVQHAESRKWKPAGIGQTQPVPVTLPHVHGVQARVSVTAAA